MGGCFSSPDADAGRSGASGRATAGSGAGAASAKAKQQAVPDFGLSDFWEVIKLLGTGARQHSTAHASYARQRGPGLQLHSC